VAAKKTSVWLLNPSGFCGLGGLAPEEFSDEIRELLRERRFGHESFPAGSGRGARGSCPVSSVET
jgi:hypothetical protein